MKIKSAYYLLLAGMLILPLFVNAQKANWQNLDLQKDSVFGISTEKAYGLLQGKTSTPVIIAVIDAGVDTAHEDLRQVLWINPKKKKGDNGTYGWSYIGSANGNVWYDNLEITRQIRQFQAKDTSRLSSNDLMAYHAEKKDFDKQRKETVDNFNGYTNFLATLDAFTRQLGKADPKLADIKAIEPQTDLSRFLVKMLTDNDDYQKYHENVVKGLQHFKEQADYQLNTAFDPRPLLVGDHYFDSRQKDYGSPDNNGPDPTHGTHVAGIIAGIRGNGLGADGIADNVRILAIRAVPEGDERDKDIANAIRYAADHGAKVINMSFGKPYSQDKRAVDEAVKYALKKDVLLVQAAGNINENIDSVANFPRRLSADEAYIVVGASGPRPDSTLKASFSNYGKTAVDVFAPGVHIYSSIPGSKYDFFDGTSMACPVVVGLAALIREYYPKLTAMQIKDIILRSVVKSDVLKDKCLTGGVVNAYEALLLAAKEEAI